MTHLTSAWTKFKRGVVHSRAFDRKLRKAVESLKGKGFPTERELDKDTPFTQVALFKVGDLPDLSDPIFATLAGDALVNFRAALDHLAWALVKRRGLLSPPGMNRKQVRARHRGVAFPMARSRKTFPDALKRGFPGISDTTITTLAHEYQPFQPTESGQAMRLLRDLSDRDKHRLLIPTFWQPGTGQYDLMHKGVGIIEQTILLPPDRRVRLKPGLPLVRVRFSVVSLLDKYVVLKGNQDLFPSVGGGWNALPLFDLIRRIVRKAIVAFEPYL